MSLDLCFIIPNIKKWTLKEEQSKTNRVKQDATVLIVHLGLMCKTPGSINENKDGKKLKVTECKAFIKALKKLKWRQV